MEYMHSGLLCGKVVKSCCKRHADKNINIMCVCRTHGTNVSLLVTGCVYTIDLYMQ